MSLLSRFSRVRFCATLWTAAYQAPLSMEFSRQEYYWSGLPFPSPGDLPNPGVEPGSPALQVASLPLSHQGILTSPPVFHASLILLKRTYHDIVFIYNDDVVGS